MAPDTPKSTTFLVSRFWQKKRKKKSEEKNKQTIRRVRKTFAQIPRNTPPPPPPRPAHNLPLTAPYPTHTHADVTKTAIGSPVNFFDPETRGSDKRFTTSAEFEWPPCRSETINFPVDRAAKLLLAVDLIVGHPLSCQRAIDGVCRRWPNPATSTRLCKPPGASKVHDFEKLLRRTFYLNIIFFFFTNGDHERRNEITS